MKLTLLSVAAFIIVLFSSCKDDEGPQFQECLTKYHFNNYEPVLFDYSDIDSVIWTRTYPNGTIETLRLHKFGEFLDTVSGELLPSSTCDPNLYIQDRMRWQFSDDSNKVRFSAEYRGTSTEISLFEAVVVFYVDQIYYRKSVARTLGDIGDTSSPDYSKSLQIGEYMLQKVWNNFGVYELHSFINDPSGSGSQSVKEDLTDCYYSVSEGPVLFLYPDSSIIHLEAI